MEYFSYFAFVCQGFGQIRCTIGKTHLLIDQRFKQFNGLIDDCELKRGAKETKVEDLQGFWDMVYFQVLDLNQGFEHLNQLKDNQWREPEVQPKEVKPVITKKAVKVVPKVAKSKPSIQSRIREQIQNMKNKKSETIEVKNESFGEKENKKIENIADSDIKWEPISKTVESKAKSIDNKSESLSTRNVLKRTPLLNSIKK